MNIASPSSPRSTASAIPISAASSAGMRTVLDDVYPAMSPSPPVGSSGALAPSPARTGTPTTRANSLCHRPAIDGATRVRIAAGAGTPWAETDHDMPFDGEFAFSPAASTGCMNLSRSLLEESSSHLKDALHGRWMDNMARRESGGFYRSPARRESGGFRAESTPSPRPRAASDSTPSALHLGPSQPSQSCVLTAARKL